MCALDVLDDLLRLCRTGLYAALEAAIAYLACHAQRTHPEQIDRQDARN